MQQPSSQSLIGALLRAYHWMDESLQNGLQDAGYRPRTRTQSMILIHVSNGITRAAELARALGVTRQAIQQQVNELESEGLITQAPDPLDRRAKQIVFSEVGSEFMRIAMESLEQAEQALTSRLGAEALEQLRDLLAKEWGPILGERHAPGRKRKNR